MLLEWRMGGTTPPTPPTPPLPDPPALPLGAGPRKRFQNTVQRPENRLDYPRFFLRRQRVSCGRFVGEKHDSAHIAAGNSRKEAGRVYRAVANGRLPSEEGKFFMLNKARVMLMAGSRRRR